MKLVFEMKSVMQTHVSHYSKLIHSAAYKFVLATV